eukprot:3765801-Amphidinium_carterae.1
MAVKRNTVVQGVFQTFRQRSWLAVMQSLTLWKRHLSFREKGMQHISPNPDLPDKGSSDTEQLNARTTWRPVTPLVTAGAATATNMIAFVGGLHTVIVSTENEQK